MKTGHSAIEKGPPALKRQSKRGQHPHRRFCRAQFDFVGNLTDRRSLSMGVWRRARCRSAMKPHDRYHERAARCLHLADQMHPHERKVMHELAACWLRLAERAEEQGHALNDKEPTGK